MLSSTQCPEPALQFGTFRKRSEPAVWLESVQLCNVPKVDLEDSLFELCHASMSALGIVAKMSPPAFGAPSARGAERTTSPKPRAERRFISAGREVTRTLDVAESDSVAAPAAASYAVGAFETESTA